MNMLVLLLVLICTKYGCYASLYRRPPVIALREHTISTLTKISNASSVDGVFTAGEQIPAIKLSVDKAVRIVTADAEDAVLAAHAIEHIATLSSADVGANANTDRRIEDDRRFEQLTECVDLCVTALPVPDVARYVWGMTVLGSNDDEKYARVINEYARRLQLHRGATVSAASEATVDAKGGNLVEDNKQNSALSVADIASMIWTVGCIKDVTGQSDHVFIRDAAQALSDDLQFGITTTAEGTNTRLSVKLAVRTIWSLAVHNVYLKPLITQCLSIVFPTEDSPSPLTVTSSLSLLWCLTEFKHFDESIMTRLLDTILAHLHSPNAQLETQPDVYQREVGQQVVRLYSSLLALQDMCSDILMAETTHGYSEQMSSAYGILERVRSIYCITSAKIPPKQLLDAPLSSVVVMLKALNTLDNSTAKGSLLEACLTNTQLYLDNDSVSGAYACALLQAMCSEPLLPGALDLEAPVAANDIGNEYVNTTLNAAMRPSAQWLRVAGRLAVRSAQYCAENVHDSTTLISTAYAVYQLGSNYNPLSEMIDSVPFSCLPALSADINAKLLVVLYSSIQTGQTITRGRFVDRLLHAQRVAEEVRGSVGAVCSPVLLAQAIEALAALSTAHSDNDSLPSTVPATAVVHPTDPLAAAAAQPEPNKAIFPPPQQSPPQTLSPALTPSPPLMPPRREPAHEPRRMEDFSGLPFGQEEDQDVERERLLALVRAAASGGTVDASYQNTPPAVSAPAALLDSIAVPSALSTETPSRQPSSPPVEHGEFPVSPLLTPDPTGPSGDLVGKDGIAILPFEEEEGVIINSERLAALVRAAAGGSDSRQPAAPAVGSAAAAPVESSRTGEVMSQDEPAEYPVSPLLTLDPTGPAGEAFTKDGIAILPFDEEEGVVINTERLAALVRAAAGITDSTASDTLATSAPIAAEANTAVKIPKLPSFAPQKLKYLSAHRLARLHRAYTVSAHVNESEPRAVRDELARRDWRHTSEVATVDATISRAEDILMLLQDFGATTAGDVDVPALYAALIHNLEALVPSTSPTDLANNPTEATVLVRVSNVLVEVLQLPQPPQKSFKQLLTVCERFLQLSADWPLCTPEGLQMDLAFATGVLEETLAQCKRQYSDASQSAVGKTFSFGKKLLTQFFRAFVN